MIRFSNILAQSHQNNAFLLVRKIYKMNNSTLFPIKGLHTILLIVLLVIIFSAGYTSSLLPKKTDSISKTQLVDIANKIDRPLADAINLFGFNTAIQILFSAKAINPDLDFHLYRKTKSDELQLLSQTIEKAMSPTLANKVTDNDDFIVIEHILEVNGAATGLLVIEQKKRIANYTPFFAFLALTSVIAFLAWFYVPIFVGKRIQINSQKLADELILITEKKDYHLSVSTDIGLGLKNLAILINNLLMSVKENEDLHIKAEEQLQSLQANLERQVINRTQELEKAILSAEQANETKTTFLATMSHEIRTPMNGIIGTIDLLRHTELSGAQFRLSSIIRDSAFSLLGILDDILDFSKIEAGKLHIDYVAFSVPQIVEEVSRVMSSIAHKNNLELNVFIDPNIPQGLFGDPVRVRQVLYNLCSNAIKFTSSTDDRVGTVSIEVVLSQKNHDFNTVDFKISDNGRGMSKVQLARIFQPFSQAEDSITREFGGTGLGLSICKSLTELMYGQIKVSSEIGIGSEFCISIPFTLSDSAVIEHKNRLKGKKIALYSPEKAQKDYVKRYLDFLGAQVYEYQEISAEQKWQNTEGLVWLINGMHDMEEVNKQLRRLSYLLEDNQQQVIVLSKLSEAKLTCKNVFYLNALPLCKSSLFNSLFIAFGLHQPKTIKTKKSFNQYQSVESARLSNQLILLVEDNLMNQQVITDQLHLLGYGVEVANDGEQGLKMWREGSYSLVLTDLHMPKMSGYDLTKAIRDEGPERADLESESIIIAITANALKGEREKCLSHGMNDYITKPVELNVLEKVISHWLPIESEKVVQPIDLERLTSYIGEDSSQHAHFLNMFIEHGNTMIQQLKSAAINDEFEELESVAHQLKSTAQTIGAFKLANSAQDLESECAKQNMDHQVVEHFRDDIEQHFFEAKQYIVQLIEQNKT